MEDQQLPKLTKKSKDAGMMMWYLKIVLAQNQKRTQPLLTIASVQTFIENLWTNI